MSKLRIQSLLALLLAAQLALNPAHAIVNPDDANEPIPEWLARVYYSTDISEGRTQFCMGALVGARWVVSALGCFNDPFRVLANYPGDATPQYFVRLGRDGDYVSVLQRYVSADQGIVLYELEEPVDIAPLRVSTQPIRELFGEDVTIFATQSSASLQHPHYNPGPGREGKCTIDGEDFRSNGLYCYIYTYPVRHSILVKTQARIIDPEGPERPVGGINDQVNIVTNGSRLYLNFTGRGYTCMEDMGLPITRRAADGEWELVGVVNAAGGVLGTPMCGPNLVNWFSVTSYYLDYFARVQAEASLRALCPAAPSPRVERHEGEVTLRWERVPQAQGYRVVYTPNAGHEQLKVHDVGEATSLSAKLDPSKRYEVTVQAYNESCTGPLSDIVFLSSK